MNMETSLLFALFLLAIGVVSLLIIGWRANREYIFALEKRIRKLEDKLKS